MSNTNDGGPAFPQPLMCDSHSKDVPYVAPIDPGMSLRDYFAAKAMAAMVAGHLKHNLDMAQTAYRIADAMLAARKDNA